MDGLLVPLSIAWVLTSGVALRLGMADRPRWLLGYFALFLALEVAADHWLLPSGALGPEIAWVCLGLSVPLIAASVFWSRYERRLAEEPRREAPGPRS